MVGFNTCRFLTPPKGSDRRLHTQERQWRLSNKRLHEDILTGPSVTGDIPAEPGGIHGSHGDGVLRVRLQLGQKHAGLLWSNLQLSQSQGHNCCSPSCTFTMDSPVFRRPSGPSCTN